jgi:hypothetical protein
MLPLQTPLMLPIVVVIQNEMIHQVRVIPTGGRPHISDNIRQRISDSRGRCEGDTLMIETTNFNANVGLTRNGNTLLNSSDMKLVERITRVGPETLQYQATVHDPKTWTRPYTVSRPLRLQPDYDMFEYGCHEGNYSIRNILAGERAAEKAAESGTPSRSSPRRSEPACRHFLSELLRRQGLDSLRRVERPVAPVHQNPALDARQVADGAETGHV